MRKDTMYKIKTPDELNMLIAMYGIDYNSVMLKEYIENIITIAKNIFYDSANINNGMHNIEKLHVAMPNEQHVMASTNLAYHMLETLASLQVINTNIYVVSVNNAAIVINTYDMNLNGPDEELAIANSKMIHDLLDDN